MVFHYVTHFSRRNDSILQTYTQKAFPQNQTVNKNINRIDASDNQISGQRLNEGAKNVFDL